MTLRMYASRKGWPLEEVTNVAPPPGAGNAGRTGRSLGLTVRKRGVDLVQTTLYQGARLTWMYA